MWWSLLISWSLWWAFTSMLSFRGVAFNILNALIQRQNGLLLYIYIDSTKFIICIHFLVRLNHLGYDFLTGRLPGLNQLMRAFDRWGTFGRTLVAALLLFMHSYLNIWSVGGLFLNLLWSALMFIRLLNTCFLLILGVVCKVIWGHWFLCFISYLLVTLGSLIVCVWSWAK